MKIYRSFLWLLIFVLIPIQSVRAEQSARAVLKDSKGVAVGAAVFAEDGDGIKVSVEAKGLKPGLHGIHIHNLGVCTPPDFSSAGPHFDLRGNRHGLKNPGGHHAGDLPNLEAKSDGKAKGTFTLKGVTLDKGVSSLFHEGGTSIVIHADPDDEMTDPSGNSGSRIVCGVIER